MVSFVQVQERPNPGWMVHQTAGTHYSQVFQRSSRTGLNGQAWQPSPSAPSPSPPSFLWLLFSSAAPGATGTRLCDTPSWLPFVLLLSQSSPDQVMLCQVGHTSGMPMLGIPGQMKLASPRLDPVPQPRPSNSKRSLSILNQETPDLLSFLQEHIQEVSRVAVNQMLLQSYSPLPTCPLLPTTPLPPMLPLSAGSSKS